MAGEVARTDTERVARLVVLGAGVIAATDDTLRRVSRDQGLEVISQPLARGQARRCCAALSCVSDAPKRSAEHQGVGPSA